MSYCACEKSNQIRLLKETKPYGAAQYNERCPIAHAQKAALAAHAQYLENANVSEDHDQERTVEGDGAREDEVAQVLSEQALPLWWGTCRCN